MELRTGDRIDRGGGRPYKPVLLWSALTMSVIAQANIRANDRGVEGGHAWVLAAASLTAIGFLAAAYLLRSHKAVTTALLVTGGVWLTRTLFVWMTNGFEEQAGWFGLAAAILAFSSYYEERLDRPGERRGGDG